MHQPVQEYWCRAWLTWAGLSNRQGGYVDLNHGPLPCQVSSATWLTCVKPDHDACGVVREWPCSPRAGQLCPSATSDEAPRLFTIVLSGLISQQIANEPAADYDTGSFTRLTDAAFDMFFARYAPNGELMQTPAHDQPTQDLLRPRGFDPRVTPRRWATVSADESRDATFRRFTTTTEEMLGQLHAWLAQDRRFDVHLPYGPMDWTVLALHAYWDSWLHERDVLLS